MALDITEFRPHIYVIRYMGNVVGSRHRAKRSHAVFVATSVALSIALLGPSNEAAPILLGAPLDRAAEAHARDPTGPLARAVDVRPHDDDERPEASAQPAREWRLVNGRHWQITAPAGEDPLSTDAREGTRGGCEPGMVEVQGKMRVHGMLDELQMQACTKWIARKWPERCAVYDRERWLSLSQELPTQRLHFCIDRFEYPNRKGEYPLILVSWYEARDTCKAEGKRLCSEDEWTFACEGEEAMPYPNGYVRDPDACLNDRPWRKFHSEVLFSRTSRGAMLELDRLWQGEPSGARALCRSPYGVYDMTGNVDEWTRSSVPGERPSVLKGGYWGPVRTRCRPATKAHDETHMFYQQGFRCCADAPAGPTARRAKGDGAVTTPHPPG